MCSRTSTTPSTSACWDNIPRLRQELDTAEAVVIGAGSGLSASAGFTYAGERFQKYFRDFIAKYGFRDMYSGGFYPFETPEEHWAYWSRYIYINRCLDPPKPVYNALLELVKDKDYFVITTNVDHCFQKAGFDKRRCSIPRGITACGNAPGPVIKRPMTTRQPSDRCWKPRAFARRRIWC